MAAGALVVVLAERDDPHDALVIVVPHMGADLGNVSAVLRYAFGGESKAGSSLPVA